MRIRDVDVIKFTDKLFCKLGLVLVWLCGVVVYFYGYRYA
jgi:hypothetical protein